jgi:hypothetical protein
MHLRLHLPSGKRNYLAALLLVAFISIICVAFSMGDNHDYEIAKREVLLRRVGHELLLQAGDSTSRVLPVKKIAENEYQVGFGKAIRFSPDSLVNTTRRLLANDPLTSDYIMNVLNCADSSVAYGYAVSANHKDDIIACLGRVQPEACYLLSIRFQPAETSTAKNGTLLGGLALLVVAGALFWRPSKRPGVLPGSDRPANGNPTPAAVPSAPEVYTLGAITFDAGARKLTLGGETAELTKTENRVLRIFAAAPNEVVERSRLQKEIWEDEGVIVGRSLDMFISKLRKKLEWDPSLKIAVIRGKGYKLQISTP